MPKKNPPAENTARKQQADLVELTPREKRAAMVPKFKDNRLDITPEQRDTMLDALSTDHSLVLQGAIHAATAVNPYKGDECDRQRNIALRLLVELAPQNGLERLLVQQLIASDAASSLCLNIGSNTDNDPAGRRKYMGLAVQFMSVQARQIELLAKLRNGNQQTVKVVHVHQGAQAIIGDVNQAPVGGRGE